MATLILIVLALILILAVVKPLLVVGLLLLMGVLVYALFWPMVAVVALVIAGVAVRGKRFCEPPRDIKRARIRPYNDDQEGPDSYRG